MTIKDIAREAGVSISTVSKIVNRKDASISEATREKVLAVVKKYNYSAYSGVAAESGQPSRLLGLLVGSNESQDFITSAIKHARQLGYSTVVCTADTLDEEFQNISVLLSHRIDGLVRYCTLPASAQIENALVKEKIPFLTVDDGQTDAAECMSFPYFQLGDAAASALFERGHRCIGFVVSEAGSACAAFQEGISQFLSGCHLAFGESDILFAHEADSDELLLFFQRHTAMICFEESVAQAVCESLELMNLRRGKDIAVLALSGSKPPKPGIAYISRPYEEFAAYMVEQLVGRIEHKAQHTSRPNFPVTLDNAGCICPPVHDATPKIVVVGCSNIDTLCILEREARSGETVQIQNRMVLPGGKGTNQALGVAKLGGQAYLISAAGKDYDGIKIYECLHENGVNTEGVISCPAVATGHAYIQIQPNGESQISIFNGANSNISSAHLDRCEPIFAAACYCLLQSELPQEIVKHAAKIAKRNGLQTILKPCAIAVLDSELLQYVDILIPNENEANILLPRVDTPAQQAAQLRNMGVQTVIVTLAEKGCYVSSEEFSGQIPAIEVDTVDTTGAADAFASTLAFYLADGAPLKQAVEYALLSGSLSTTRYGVPPALVDRCTLELLAKRQKSFHTI